MIEAIELTSRNRGRTGGAARRGRPVVDHVSFDVYPGQVTVLFGAPGVGKSTVLRMMAEQVPAKGRTLFNGRAYHALRPAVREVGMVLDPDALHPGRTVRHHLALYAAAGGVGKSRIAEVLEIGGLTLQADVRCGRLDPGQRQRLGIAAALLGDPAALLLDEPHALDAHGLTWFNALIRAYAAQGRTVLVAAADPAAIAPSADHVVVLRRDAEDGRTRVVASRSATDVFDPHRAAVVVVRSPQAARLATVLEADGAVLANAGPGTLEVRGLDRARIGELAHAAGVCLHELAETAADDEAYFGIRPPRKEIAPAPIEVVEAEDVAVGVSAGPRTGWRSGVRLVGGVRGGVRVDDVEDIEDIEDAVVVEPEAPRESMMVPQQGAASVGGGDAPGASAMEGPREPATEGDNVAGRAVSVPQQESSARSGEADGAAGSAAGSSAGADGDALDSAADLPWRGSQAAVEPAAPDESVEIPGQPLRQEPPRAKEPALAVAGQQAAMGQADRDDLAASKQQVASVTTVSAQDHPAVPGQQAAPVATASAQEDAAVSERQAASATVPAQDHPAVPGQQAAPVATASAQEDAAVSERQDAVVPAAQGHAETALAAVSTGPRTPDPDYAAELAAAYAQGFGEESETDAPAPQSPSSRVKLTSVVLAPSATPLSEPEEASA